MPKRRKNRRKGGGGGGGGGNGGGGGGSAGVSVTKSAAAAAAAAKTSSPAPSPAPAPAPAPAAAGSNSGAGVKKIHVATPEITSDLNKCTMVQLRDILNQLGVAPESIPTKRDARVKMIKDLRAAGGLATEEDPTPVAAEDAKEKSKEASKEEPKEASKEESKEEPKEASKEEPKDAAAPPLPDSPDSPKASEEPAAAAAAADVEGDDVAALAGSPTVGVDGRPINMEKTSGRLADALATRAPATQLKDSAIMSDKQAPAIQGVAKKLEREMAKDHVRHDLETRATADDLAARGVLFSDKQAPAIQGVAKQLEREMAKDHVRHDLETRATADDLAARGVLFSDKQAPAIQGVAKKLEREMAKDHVRHDLETRATADDLAARGVLFSDKQAPAIQGVAKKLEREMAKDHVRHDLETRQKYEDLQARGIIHTDPGTAPSEAAAIEDVNRVGRREKLERAIAHRASVTELRARHIIDREEFAEANHPPEISDRELARARYAMSLQAAARLYDLGFIDFERLGRLKELVLTDHESVIAAVESYEADESSNAASELLDTMLRIALRA